MVSTGMKCVKYVLFGFNFLVFLAGLALVVVGALVMTKFKEYLAFFEGNINASAIFILVVGIIVFIIGFFGCCGAIKENHCMIVTFAVLLSIVLVLQIVVAIVAFVFRHKISSGLKEEMKNATVNYARPLYQGVTEAWDKVQKQFECCGADNYTDWTKNEMLRSNHSVPDSCCVNITKGCGYGKISNPRGIYSTGCVKSFGDWVQINIGIVGGVAAALCLIQIIGIAIASCLASAIKRDYEVV